MVVCIVIFTPVHGRRRAKGPQADDGLNGVEALVGSDLLVSHGCLRECEHESTTHTGLPTASCRRL